MSDSDNPTDKEIADTLHGLDPEPNTLVRDFKVEFERIRCLTCDMSFYVSKYWRQQRKDNHLTFYCPNGHSMWYPKTDGE